MISLDSLRFLRKKKFWIASVSVLIIIIMIFVDFNQSEKEQTYDYYTMQSVEGVVSYYLVEEQEDYVEQVKKITKTLAPALKKNDWKKANQAVSDLYYIKAANTLKMTSGDNPDLYYHNYYRGKEDVEKVVKERKLPVIDEDILEDMYYDDLTITSWGDTIGYAESFQTLRLKAQYFEGLANAGIPALTYNTIDSSTIIVQFIRAMFPLLPILIVALMCYDALQEDRDSGVIKVLLTQPIKRSNYLKKKIMLNIKAVCSIFLIPLLIISLCYGIFDHYGSISTPVLSNVKGITSLQIQANTLKEMENGKNIDRYSGNMSQIGAIGITKYYPVPVTSFSPNPEYDFLKMWQFVGLCSIMALLILAFYVLLTTACTIVFKNKIVALVIALLIMLVGMFFSQPSNNAAIFAILPFTYMNPVDILSGYSSYSYLSGLLALLVSNIVLYAVCISLFKRRDDVS